MDPVGDSRSCIGQKTLSGILVLAGRNRVKHPCEQTAQIAGRRSCDPASLPAKPYPLRILSDKERQGSRAGLGSDHCLGEETLPRHGEISTRRPSLTAPADRHQPCGTEDWRITGAAVSVP